jgi:hypothetical protein
MTILPQSPINDPINNPAHYNSGNAHCECGRRIECIDVTRGMNFNLGNAIKYIWRAKYKGSYLDDLKKAVWYLKDAIKCAEGRSGDDTGNTGRV